MFCQFRFQIKFVLPFFVAVLFQLVFLSVVSAQIALVTGWEVDESLAGRKAAIFTAFKSGSVDADRAGLDAFFDKYYFARWTRPENTGLVQQTFVKEFLTQDLRDSTGNAREYLLAKSFDTLKKIAADQNASAPSRYNAILTIGQLAQREPAGRGTPPTPYAQALPYLLGEYQKKENPKFIQLGALIGIVRFAEIGIADETTKNNTVPELFIATIQSGQAKQDGNKEEQEMTDWFRSYALDGLGALKSVGANGRVVKVLSEVIENNLETIEFRTHAAKILGDLNFAEAGTALNQQQYQQIGTQLIALMKTTADDQFKMVDKLYNKARISKDGVPQDFADVSSIPTNTVLEPEFALLTPDQQIEVTGAVQSVKSNILNVMNGMRGTRLTGTANAGILPMFPSDDPVAAKINATVKLIAPLFKVLDEGPPEDLTKQRSLNQFGSELSSEMSSGGTRAKPKDDKPQLKVNFSAIRDALQKMSDELGAIISGSGSSAGK
ncbi:MAG: hypothetical protein LBQ50_08915 [Planctomycetaceae bacterium]|jgi:hypothetical protein|nr:hypothetical protein [Planctomycetaceae bacterium]